MVTVKIRDGLYTFSPEDGWKSKSGEKLPLLTILNDLWEEHYGAEAAVYQLTVEALHLQAVTDLFKAEVVKDDRKSEPIDPEVVY